MHVCGLAHVASIIGVLARREYIFRLLLMKVLLALAVSCRSFVESAFLRTAWTLAFLGPCFVWGRRVFLRNLTGRIVAQAYACARGGSFNRIDECGFLGELFTTLGGSRVRIPFAVD